MAFEYFTIKSKLSGLVLDIQSANESPGAHVIPWEFHGKDNQIWYEDPSTGTIRSKLNNFCMDIEGDQLVLNPLKPGNDNQQWERHDNHIRKRQQHNMALDIYGSKSEPGAKIGPYELHGGANQSWDFEYVGGRANLAAQTLLSSSPFYIVSEMNEKVVDIQGGSSMEDTKIITWSKNSNEALKNQLWYCDPRGFIHSSLNDMVFASTDSGKKLKMKPYSEEPRDQWRIEDKKIVNGVGECLNIIDSRNEDGAKLCSVRYKEKPSQHWRIDYVNYV